MVLFFVCTLLLSIAGMAALLTIKRWELETGNMLFGGIRPKVGRKAHALLVWVESVLPLIVLNYSRRTGHRVQETLHRKVAQGLIATEQGLENLLKQLRGVTEHPKSSKQASAFLREVAEHKRQLVSSTRAIEEPALETKEE